MRFPCKLVQEVERDAINFVVDVETLDVFAMVFHNDIDEVINGAVFISDENFAVENFVVAKDVVDHLLINILGGCLEGNLHTAGGLGFEVDVSGDVSLLFRYDWSQHLLV